MIIDFFTQTLKILSYNANTQIKKHIIVVPKSNSSYMMRLSGCNKKTNK